jgi:hypothetical protein
VYDEKMLEVVRTEITRRIGTLPIAHHALPDWAKKWMKEGAPEEFASVFNNKMAEAVMLCTPPTPKKAPDANS